MDQQFIELFDVREAVDEARRREREERKRRVGGQGDPMTRVVSLP